MTTPTDKQPLKEPQLKPVGGGVPKPHPPLPGPPVPKPPPPPPAQTAQYSFVLESMDIVYPRSPSKDTDFVSFALQLATNPMYEPFAVGLGDLGPGHHPLNLKFGPITVAPPDQVSFSYLIANSGYGGGGEGNAQVAIDAVADVAGAILNKYYPGLGTAVDFAAKGLAGILTANCDGVVVADKVAYQGGWPPPGGQVIVPLTGADLWSWTYLGTHRETREYPGTDSAVGCGRNSLYYVSWSITKD